MLPLPVKQGEKINLFDPLMENIKSEFGPQVAERLENTLRLLQEYRNSLIETQKYIADMSSLKRVAMQSKIYLSMWSSVCQSFTFGPEKGSIDIKFTWTDPYKKKKTVNANPNSERMAILYNLGVVYNQIGQNLANLNGNHKEAAGELMTAAWIFEELRTELGSYNLRDLGVDLSDQHVHMCSHMMKAQAQHCVYEHLRTATPDKYGLMAKVVMQAAVCYGSAYSYASTHPVSTVADEKNFIRALQCNEYYYIAQANYLGCLDYQARCEKESMGIGKAISYAKKTIEILEKAMKEEKRLPPSALSRFASLLEEARKKEAFLNAKNDKIYHEKVPANPDEIDPLMFSKTKSLEDELSQTFDGKAIFQRMVPIGVQELEEEYKRQAELVIKQGYNIAATIDSLQDRFLLKHNLPSALYAVAEEQELPEDLWQKVKQCKEAENNSGLKETLHHATTLSANNITTLDKLFAKLEQEEKDDQAMREKHGANWTAEVSQKANHSIKRQLKYYKAKYVQGRKVDERLKKMLVDSKEGLNLLELDKAELISKLPKTKSSGKGISPTAQK